MRYAGIIKNDVSAGSGVCVTVFVQGCPFRCKGCHNPETWDYNGGKEFTNETLDEILLALDANDVQRNFCVMGGEPLCNENIFLTTLLVKTVRERYPDINIYVWTGYEWDKLQRQADTQLQLIFKLADYVIAGPFDLAQRDITLPMRGSRNQKVIDLKTGEEVECLNQVI